MNKLIGISLLLFSLCLFGVRISKKIIFNQEVSGYLKRAADANTIEIAAKELQRSISYLEKNQIMEGYTSILYNTPDEDIEFWYNNIKASHNELVNLKTSSTLEKTNMLIKLRETLVDGGSKTKVTYPKGLDVYPHNTIWAVLMSIALACTFIGIMLLSVVYSKKESIDK